MFSYIFILWLLFIIYSIKGLLDNQLRRILDIPLRGILDIQLKRILDIQLRGILDIQLRGILDIQLRGILDIFIIKSLQFKVEGDELFRNSVFLLYPGLI